jgi:hypothetical protein
VKGFRVLLALVVNSTALASVINVPAAQPRIQAGINVANNGDSVLVAPGTYTENINFMGKAITVKSSKGASVTIIDGGGVAPVVTFNMNEEQRHSEQHRIYRSWHRSLLWVATDSGKYHKEQQHAGGIRRN